MYYSAENCETLKTEHLEVAGKCQRLVQSYLMRNWKDSRAREFATQGLLRRLQTLVRCIDNVFRIFPPDRAELPLPTSDELFDGMINIQAFVFNVFGSIDNLAWIWVQEKSLAKEDGSAIPSAWVGLSKNNIFVRNSLSNEFKKYLTVIKFDVWFDNLGSFRHALAHRIPLYIPPYTIPNDKETVYRQLEDHKREAIYVRRDFAEYKRLETEQKALATFIPQMTHSFEEKSDVISFHPQLLTDFLTIEGLAEKMLQELDGQREPGDTDAVC